MTKERKNEIWAMLPEDLKENVKHIYSSYHPYNRTPDEAIRDIIEVIFGYYNLTAQAEEKPKEPRFKMGDKVKMPFCGGEVATITEIKIVNRLPKYIAAGQEWCECHLEPYPSEKAESDENSVFTAQKREMPTGIGISDSKIQSESAESVETSTKEDAYFAYRLDLAKEIAVAIINSGTLSDGIANDSVNIANEIVKRLKETEI